MKWCLVNYALLQNEFHQLGPCDTELGSIIPPTSASLPMHVYCLYSAAYGDVKWTFLKYLQLQITIIHGVFKQKKLLGLPLSFIN